MKILGNIHVKQLLLELAQQHSVEAVLEHAVTTLAASAALVRVWLVEPGDNCDACRDAEACQKAQTSRNAQVSPNAQDSQNLRQCLHLRASAGRSTQKPFTCWNSVERSAFSRFPLGVRKVGSIAQSGLPLEVPRITGNESWIADPAWIRAESICSFAGQPLVCKGRTLGVMAIFSRRAFAPDELELLRMVADHIAYAIANAKAFETIKTLKSQKEQENALLREELKDARQFRGIIGTSAQIEEIRERIRLVGPTDASVLIEGASGTGKEMVAHEVHQQSPRRDYAMIKINCAAIPRELFESEFFGHVRGAFTGAVRDRVGYFQAADGGTLFLDEVGEIPLDLQGKLLRTLQEGEYRRVGEERVLKVNVRLIAATNRDLRYAVQSGTFREDLYYRLQVFPILTPRLKERPQDIPLLAEHFIRLICQKLNKPIFRLTDEQTGMLMDYDWPGNIRELQNLIERIAITGQPAPLLSELTAHRPAPQARFNRETHRPGADEAWPAKAPALADELPKVLTQAQLREAEKNNMLRALERTNQLIYGPRGAARLLGMKPTTLISRLRRLGIYPKSGQSNTDESA